ncbi:MAG: class I SAM-dependent methyltransferase [Sphingobacteriaceae bacterium]|nr:class I SAM-dependent methyltransferase [Sphingobacteriaceae bacterium]
MGDVTGQSILHLQCHFGQDSLSLARLGAQVTGVDLSNQAIAHAQRLAGELQSDVRFICCDVYELPQQLNEQFDVVFTSYGTIGWLPDLDRWAQTIAHFLKPGGKLVFVEFHPVVWMFSNDFKSIVYRYFKSDPIVETETGSYADTHAPVQLTSVTWNHGLGEVMSSLLRLRLQITHFEEFDYSPYNCFQGTEAIAPGKFRIAHLGDKIPMVYAICAVKKSNHRTSLSD